MSTIQPPDQPQQYQPTQYANPYTDPPLYQSTEINPYIDYSSYIVIPPPPPPRKRRVIWQIIYILFFATLLISGTVFIMHIMTSNTKQSVMPQNSQITPPTTIPEITPTVIPTAITIPTSSLTASTLYEDFTYVSLPVTNPIIISNNWWLSMGESYYPGKGGIQFTDTNSNADLEIAVFNGAAAATIDAKQATSYPNGWAAQYIQVNTCVIFSAAGPVDISYYKPTLQSFCI